MKDNNLVSIIIPSYNSERYISQTIDSVLARTYQNWEMVIKDDVSSDNSNEIIEEYYKKDSHIKLIKLEKNSGPAVVRNKAIEEAKRSLVLADIRGLYTGMPIKKDCRYSVFDYCIAKSSHQVNNNIEKLANEY